MNGDTVSDNSFAIGDRLQADVESTYVDARARLEVLYSNNDNAAAKLLIVPTGFVHVEPLPQFGVIVGNNFYKRFAIPSGYLAAADDTTKYARLLTDSLGHDGYVTFGDSAALYTNGFAAGVTTNWTFGEDEDVYLKAAGGATICPTSDEVEKAVDFGVNAGMLQVFDVGITAHDVTEDTRKFGVFAGLTHIPNVVLNAGFYYNFTSSDYLPEAKITHKKKGYNEYDKQKTKYAFGLSGGYRFENGFGIYADFISGLTNEYIGKVKYYDSKGNLIDTKIKTIVRGASAVKYEDGKGTETDGYTEEAVPLYAQLRVTYPLNDTTELACNVKVRTMIRDSSQTWLTFYPRVTIGFPVGSGAIGAGLRLDMNLTRYDGVSGISVPLTYTYKFKKKFK